MRKLKNISIILMLVLCTPLFAGCGSSVPEPSEHEYPWTVILHMQYELNTSVLQKNLDDLATALSTKFDGKDVALYGMGASSAYFRIALEFSGEKTINGEVYESGYFGLNDYFNLGMSDDQLITLVNQEWEKNLFIRTRTLTFENPWKHVLSNVGSLTVLADLIKEIGDAEIKITGMPVYEYEFLSSYRRHVADKTGTSRETGMYQYYFAFGGEGEIETIVIVDKFENGAIWYGLAVAAMAVFMVIVYFVAKRKEQRVKVLPEAKKQPSGENPFMS